MQAMASVCTPLPVRPARKAARAVARAAPVRAALKQSRPAKVRLF
jgi:hypothetical protein